MLTTIIELCIVIAMFFIYKYFVPMLQDSTLKKFAQIAVAAANEKHLVNEITDKWNYALSVMESKLKKYHIKYDADEVAEYLKAAVTMLRTEISGTDAQKLDKE